MGGNAFENTQRLTKLELIQLKNQIIDFLISIGIEKVEMPGIYSDKESFGDVDIVYVSNNVDFFDDFQREFYAKFPPAGSNCKIRLLVGDSHSEELVQLVENELDGELVDFLFIDGDHSEVGVAQDFEMYKKFVRKGGLIAFHDIVDNQPLEMNQVQFFWKKIKDQYEHYELIDDINQCGYGIGVIRI